MNWPAFDHADKLFLLVVMLIVVFAIDGDPVYSDLLKTAGGGLLALLVSGNTKDKQKP